jgi:hypothetical protein
VNSDVIREHILPKFERVRQTHGSWMVSCPVPSHGSGRGDRNPSLSVTEGRDQAVIFHCHGGCDQDDVKSAIISLGIDWALCSRPRDTVDTDDWMPCGKKDDGTYDPDHRKVAEYLYRDADDAIVFAVARCALKGSGCQGFRQWRPDPTSKSGKRWSRRLADGSLAGDGIPYRLPEVLAAIADRNVYVVEGEKDADRLWSMGYAATCNAGGAGKWTGRHATWLDGADVMIVADRDKPGINHAVQVANTLIPHARSIEVLRAVTGKDTSDHLDAGGSVHTLVSVATPLTEPKTMIGATA